MWVKSELAMTLSRCSHEFLALAADLVARALVGFIASIIDGLDSVFGDGAAGILVTKGRKNCGNQIVEFCYFTVNKAFRELTFVTSLSCLLGIY